MATYKVTFLINGGLMLILNVESHESIEKITDLLEDYGQSINATYLYKELVA